MRLAAAHRPSSGPHPMPSHTPLRQCAPVEHAAPGSPARPCGKSSTTSVSGLDAAGDTIRGDADSIGTGDSTGAARVGTRDDEAGTCTSVAVDGGGDSTAGVEQATTEPKTSVASARSGRMSNRSIVGLDGSEEANISLAPATWQAIFCNHA
jgi:hypothetical protein